VKAQHQLQHIATPSEIEAASEQQSEFILVRLFDRLVKFLDNWLFEPALTVRRFAHILILFIPVALAIPAVLFGQQLDGDEKAGTLWWYDFLAKQMERAGPTFIKVMLFS
jgi:aarF domain-containing kinase